MFSQFIGAPRGAAFLALLGLLPLVGCGNGRPEVVPVSGQVWMDGAPLAAGVAGFVRVEPADGRAASGRIDPQTGKFTLTTYETGDGVLSGTHPVAVIVQAPAGGTTVSLIPEKYGESATSGLTVTIDGPTDALTIELTGGLKKAPAATGPGGDDPGPGV
jgi:hypothetical protein